MKNRYPNPDELYACELKTTFWIDAANSLPATVRERYLGYFQQAERWDLALDAVVEFFSRPKAPRSRPFQTPKRA